jgi:hypothetical protein
MPGVAAVFREVAYSRSTTDREKRLSKISISPDP